MFRDFFSSHGRWDVSAPAAYQRHHNQSSNDCAQKRLNRRSSRFHKHVSDSNVRGLNDDSSAQSVTNAFPSAANGHQQEEGDNADNDVWELYAFWHGLNVPLRHKKS